MNTCVVCKRPMSKRAFAREDGRFVCNKCYGKDDYKKYREHWFVRSMKYKKPKLKKRRNHKPSEGQTYFDWE